MKISSINSNRILISHLVELNGSNPYTSHPLAVQRQLLIVSLVQKGVITVLEENGTLVYEYEI